MNCQKFILFIILGLPLFGKSINGFVRDDANGETLSFVNVFIKDSNLGASTNQEGYFVIQNVTNGEFVIVASIIGYQLTQQKITLGTEENDRIEFRLPISHVEGEEVNVSAIRQSFNNWQNPAGLL